MDENKLEFYALVNHLIRQQDDIYKNVASRMGLSDTNFWMLYGLCESEGPCTQHTLCQGWFYAQQTVHSAFKQLGHM